MGSQTVIVPQKENTAKMRTAPIGVQIRNDYEIWECEAQGDS